MTLLRHAIDPDAVAAVLRDDLSDFSQVFLHLSILLSDENRDELLELHPSRKTGTGGMLAEDKA